MSVVTKKLSNYVKAKKVNISALARETGVPYSALYNSLCEEERDRSLRDDEFVAVCLFLGVDPMDFAEKPEKEA